jgi:hypothetical protein
VIKIYFPTNLLTQIIDDFLGIMAGDRVLERILLPIFENILIILIIKRQKPSEAPNAFGAENERKYSVSCAPQRNFINNLG